MTIEILAKIITLFLVVLLPIALAFMIGKELENIRQEAVKRGYAYWDVKPDGSTEFKWKEGEMK